MSANLYTKKFNPALLSPRISERIELVKKLAELPNIIGEKAKAAIENISKEQTAEHAMSAILDLQRLYWIGFLELADSDRIIDGYKNNLFPAWKDFVALDTSHKNKKIVADALMNGDPKQGAPILLTVADSSRGIAEQIIERALKEQKEIDVWVDDPVFQRQLHMSGTEESAAKHGEQTAKRRENVARSILFNSSDTSFDLGKEKVPKEITRAFNGAMSARKKEHSKGLMFTATRLPTNKMLEIDPKLIDIFIKTAVLKSKDLEVPNTYFQAKVNAADIVEIRNSDGTNIKFSKKDFDAVDSRMARNIPGGQVFAGLVRYSMNGVVVAKGLHLPQKKKEAIEDITLEIENGIITKFTAAKNQKLLDKLMATDEGAKELGQFGFGTNFNHFGHVANSMLATKTAGSAYLTIGRASEEDSYLGKDVKLDNGVKSDLRLDVAISLFNKDGFIALDGEVLMEHGRYLAPELQKLNP